MWDIEPRGAYTDELRYKAVKTPTGRFYSRREAAHRAGEINGDTPQRPIDGKWRNVARHAERRREWPRGWWKEAAERYNASHGRIGRD